MISYYKIFLTPSTRYCRLLFLFLTWFQGFNPFVSGYEFELVLSGFTKDNINTIMNVVLIPNTIILIIMAPRIEKIGWMRCMMGYMIGRWVLFAFLLLTFPSDHGHSFMTSVPIVSLAYFLIQGFETFSFILLSIRINSFPVMGVSAMFITMLNSGYNFGNNRTLALLAIDKWGWKASAAAGLLFQLTLIIFLPKIYQAANEAELGLPEDLQEPPSSKRTSNR